MTLGRRQRAWLWVMGLITGAITIPIGYLGIRGLVDLQRLDRDGRSTCAEVTDRRQTQKWRGVEHEVKYRFVVGGSAYTHSDETTRDDLWALVLEREWNRSLETGCVDVVYLPQDPSVNHPAHADTLDNPVGNKVAALVMCAMCFGLFGAGARGIFRVARTRLWRFARVDADVWLLVRDGEERRIGPRDVRRARLITLPSAQVHPPWRFECDVLELRPFEGPALVVEARPGSDVAAVLARLDALGVLRRKRAG